MISIDYGSPEDVDSWMHLVQMVNDSLPGSETEAAQDYNAPVPESFDVIDLPEADYLMFQGKSFRTSNLYLN